MIHLAFAPDQIISWETQNHGAKCLSRKVSPEAMYGSKFLYESKGSGVWLSQNLCLVKIGISCDTGAHEQRMDAILLQSGVPHYLCFWANVMTLSASNSLLSSMTLTADSIFLNPIGIISHASTTPASNGKHTEHPDIRLPREYTTERLRSDVAPRKLGLLLRVDKVYHTRCITKAIWI